MKSASKYSDDRMVIRDKCDYIIKRLKETYTSGGVKGIFDENPCYLVATLEVYKQHPFMRADYYIDKVLTVIEKF